MTIMIQDQDEEERSCIICDRHDSRYLLELANYRTSFEAEVETEIWLCESCVIPIKHTIDSLVTEQIDLKVNEKLR